MRVILTLTPSEAPLLRENMSMLFKNGFRRLDIFPDVFTLWPKEVLKQLEKNLRALIDALNNDYLHDYDLRLLNEVMGKVCAVLNLDEKKVVLDSVRTRFGERTMHGSARVYDDEAMLKKTEQGYLTERGKPKAKVRMMKIAGIELRIPPRIKPSMKARVNPDISRRNLQSFRSKADQASIVSSLKDLGNRGQGNLPPNRSSY
jgi:ribosomal protein S24E